MFFKLFLENANGDRVDMTTTANQYMTSRVEGLNPPTGTISTSSYAGMDGSYLNNAFIEKRNVVISFEMRGVGVEARRHQLYNVTAAKAYSDIVREVVTQNALLSDNRRIPGLSLGTVTGTCWEQTATLQISYTNLMQWVYTICEKLGGTANIRLVKSSGEQYRMVFDLSEGADRSIMQEDNPHIIFSDAYSNLLSFSYAEDSSVQKNFAYIFGQGKGDERKRTTYCEGVEPTYLERYELYVDADDISETEQVEGETIPIPEEKYIELLKTRGSERLVLPKTASESDIAAHNTQYVYNRDYFVGDYVTVQHRRFGMMQPQIQLVGMIEGFDQNRRSLTPTFKEV